MEVFPYTNCHQSPWQLTLSHQYVSNEFLCSWVTVDSCNWCKIKDYSIVTTFCHGPRRRQAMALASPIRDESNKFKNRQEQTCLHCPVDWNKHACKTLWQFVTAIGIFRIRWAMGQCRVGPCLHCIKKPNKPIIVIPWAVKAVTVGNAPPPFLTAHYTRVGWMFTMGVVACHFTYLKPFYLSETTFLNAYMHST